MPTFLILLRFSSFNNNNNNSIYRRISIRKVVYEWQNRKERRRRKKAKEDAELLIETRIVWKNYYQLEIYSNYAKQKPPQMA